MRCSTFSQAAERAARAGALLLALLLAAGPAGAASVELFAPRAFGYLIGDTIAHEAIITLDPGYVLDASTLPQPRPVTYWLDLTAVNLAELKEKEGARRYRLRLTYQTFYAPLEPRALDIPAVPLAARDGDKRLLLTVPAWTFVTSPLREITSSRAANPMALQPDATPLPYPVQGDLRAAAAAAGIAAACLLALAILNGWGPFATRRLPFTAAARRMRHLLSGDASPGAYSAALLLLHRAFDDAAGRRLLADDVPGFITRTPGLAPDADDIARFFCASRIAFFGTGTGAALALLPAASLLALARRLAAAERAGAPRVRPVLVPEAAS